LGILAGDHLKSASDLGVPIVAVGLLYGAGYFRQGLDAAGEQTESYPELDPSSVPLVLLREATGIPVDIAICLPDAAVLHAQVWRAAVGRVPLLLLDSNVPANAPELRSLTERLYGGRGADRLHQELLLGVGGVRALRAFSRLTGAPEPSVYHMNEGHAGFLGVERLRERIDADADVDAAVDAVRRSTVFTTHTPVPAGIDRFPMDLIEEHFDGPEWERIGVDMIATFGAEVAPDGDPSVFNMAYMGLRLSARANAVSMLHRVVSREMFAPLWPGVPPQQVPIGSITNGVHSPTWVHPRMAALGERADASPGGWLGEAVSESDLWAIKREMREALVQDVRTRLRASGMERGHSLDDLDWVDGALDPDVLTIGFARRVPTYKRLTLMLREPDRLRDILLNHPAGRVQMVVAGKAHPDDGGGKELLREFVAFADDPSVRGSVAFLPNYDMAMAATIFPGCDVWLNNPLRPYEACGTSGMKAALNGALNLSIRDGWWDEWSDGINGWDIPSADTVGEGEARDDAEATSLYRILQEQVVPLFYDHDRESGLPLRWLARVRHTLETLGPKVQATRMVRDYTNNYYVPAAMDAAGM
jgi:starch phosphorylase